MVINFYTMVFFLYIIDEMINLSNKSLKSVFEKSEIYVGKRIQLIKDLIKYYKANRDDITKEIICSLLLQSGYNNELDDELDDEERDIVSEIMEIKNTIYSNNRIIIIDLDCNTELKNEVIKFYFNIEMLFDFDSILFYLENIYNVIKNDEFIKLFNSVFYKEEYINKILIILIIILMESKIKYYIPKKKEMLKIILKEYNNNPSNIIKLLIIKCYSYVIMDGI